MDNQKLIDEKVKEAFKLNAQMKNSLFIGGLAFMACWLGSLVAFGLHQQYLSVFLLLNGMLIDQACTKIRNGQVERYNNLADEVNELGAKLGVETKMEYQNV